MLLQDGQGGDRAALPGDGDGLPGHQAVLGQRSADIRCPAASRSSSRSGPAARAEVGSLAYRSTRRRLRTNSGAQVVDAVGVVGVLVGHQHAVEPVDLGVEQLLAQVRRGVDQHPGAAVERLVGSTSSEVRRRRFFGLLGSQAPQPSAGRGTPIDDPQPRMVKRNRHAAAARGRGTLLNSRKKFSVVWRAISSGETPRVSASTLAVSTT